MSSPTPFKATSNSLILFSYDDLVRASDGFSTSNLIGEGGFGPVYKGRLENGQVISVVVFVPDF